MVGEVNLCVHNFEDFIESLQFKDFMDSSQLETSIFQLSWVMTPLFLGILFSIIT